VRVVLEREVDRLARVERYADDVDPLVAVEQQADRLRKQRIVVHDQNADRPQRVPAPTVTFFPTSVLPRLQL
jgi:hypothetical protein